MPDRFGLIDEVLELVYVCDIETYELLYLNSAGRKSFGIKDISGKKCYEVLQSRKMPCEFCTNHRLNENEFFTWEHTNVLNGRHYLLKDKLIEMDGRRARMEIALDITESFKESEALRGLLAAQELLLRCVRMLHGSKNLQATLGEILMLLGDFLGAQRAYVFKICGGKMDNTFEWCAPGVQAQIENLQGLDVHLIDRWRIYFDRHECMFTYDMENLKTSSPVEYEALSAQGIQRMVTCPILVDGNLVGYMGVDNPPEEKLRSVGRLLDTLAYFIESIWRRQQDEEKLQQLSYFDTLTGVLNRNAFMRDVGAPLNAPKRNLGVVYVDVNGMKDINDKYGHMYGDSHLVRLTRTILTVFPKSQVYRVGGDEFIALCEGVNEKKFHSAVQTLKRIFSSKNGCSASVGYQWSACCTDIQQLVFNADEIMYEDKKNFYRSRRFSGRYRHSSDDVLGMTQEGQLQSMLEKEQFLLYLQPKVSFDDRKIIGAEALVRYRTSAGEIIAPDQFIPVLEEARIISVLDFYMFERACCQLAQWKNQGVDHIPLSVNFSRHSLAEMGFTEKIYRLFSKYELNPALIKIEITESVEEEDHYAFLSVMEELRSKGFSVSIDDFGVRHANFSLFVACDFDELKIDRCLITDITTNPKAQAVVQSVSDVCHRMNVQLIIEGVETEEQLRLLRAMNCRGGQGYLFSRPLPVAEFEQIYCPETVPV